ncbi:MAG: hypothetical protein IJW17_05095 [Lentisphaeria bacterium]|nr:hypothetical protein [Lentisphaeria bacterium]
MKFTLLEVVTAIGILALSLAGLLQLLTSSQERISKNVDLWHHTHMMMQAAEYALLQEGEEELAVPQEIFDYPDYFCQITYEELDEELLPEELSNQQGQLPLKGVKVVIQRNSDQKEVASVIVDRFSYEENNP